MALSVVHTGGNNVGGSAVDSDSWTSTAGSLIIAICQGFGITAMANGDVTDHSMGNSYTLAVSRVGGGSGLSAGVWYNNAGTRGASHQVLYTATGGSGVISIVEVTGQDLSSVLDSATKATATDAASPWDVTAAASISGNQIAVYGVILDTFDVFAWTPPSGYSNVMNDTGTVDFARETSYKINETGTPTVGATSSHTASSAVEIFATFKEAGGGPVVTLPSDNPPIGISGRGAGW